MYTSAHAHSGVSWLKLHSRLVSFMVSDFKNKQSEHCSGEKVRERERLIGNDVIFKLHAVHISWFSFKSARGETRKIFSQMCIFAIYGHSGARVKWQQWFWWSPEVASSVRLWGRWHTVGVFFLAFTVSFGLHKFSQYAGFISDGGQCYVTYLKCAMNYLPISWMHF